MNGVVYDDDIFNINENIDGCVGVLLENKKVSHFVD